MSGCFRSIAAEMPKEKKDTKVYSLRTSRVKKVDYISVSKFYGKYKEILKLELVNSPSGLARAIHEPSINRPGLAIAGFYAYFAHKRIQVFGSAEIAYLNKLPENMRKSRVQRMYRCEVPCIVFSRGQIPSREIIELANEAGVCVFKTSLVSMKFVNAATIILENEFAESTTVHGCMLDIRGVGILIRGKSGVGKSEAALGLIERGAALVADDLVCLQNIGGEIITNSPEASKGYLEVRGLGIVNVTNLFGLKAWRQNKRLDLIITLVPASQMEQLDRLGIERMYYKVLGERIQHIELPVAPGRDTARLIEVAAIDQHLKGIGFDMAGEFNKRLMTKFIEQSREEKGL